MNNLLEAMAESELREMLRRYLELLPDSSENRAERDRVGRWLTTLSLRATPVFVNGPLTQQVQGWDFVR